MKKLLSVLLCIAVLLSFTAFAEDTPPAQETTTVSIEVNKEEVVVGDTELTISIKIDNLTQSLSAAAFVVKIDSDEITVTDIAPVAETEYNYEINLTDVTPVENAYIYEVPLTVTPDYMADSPADVEISLVSAVLTDANDPPAEVESVVDTTPKEVSVINPEIKAKLSFEYKIETILTAETPTFAVTYEAVTDGQEEDTPSGDDSGAAAASEGGDGASGGDGDGATGDPIPVEPTQIETTLTLKADGKTVEVTPVSALENGTYKVNIIADGYLIPENITFTIDAEHTVPEWTAELTAGEMIADGVIDLYDFHDLCKTIGSDAPAVKYDLNRDGSVDEKDVSLLVKNWTL